MRLARATIVYGAIAWSFLYATWTRPAFALSFKNQFLKFEGPERWACELEGAEYVCQDTRPEVRRDSIAVFAAKLRGEQDSIVEYRKYLEAAKTWKAPDGKTVVSKVVKVGNVVIAGHPWVDATQDDSEVVGFRTRYFATVKNDIGVLVTFSVRKDKYDQMLPGFDAMMKTLQVRRRGADDTDAAGEPAPSSTAVPSASAAPIASATPIASASSNAAVTSGDSASKNASKSRSCGCELPGAPERGLGSAVALLVAAVLRSRRAGRCPRSGP